MLLIAPCGDGVGSWQLWLMPWKGCSIQRYQLAETCFLGKSGCPFCRMGLEPWDLYRGKLAALPKSVQVAHSGARDHGSVNPMSSSNLLLGGFSSVHLEDPPPLSAMELSYGPGALVPLCRESWELSQQGLCLSGSRQPKESPPAQGLSSQSSKVGRDKQAQQATGLFVGLVEADGLRVHFTVTLA